MALGRKAKQCSASKQDRPLSISTIICSHEHLFYDEQATSGMCPLGDPWLSQEDIKYTEAAHSPLGYVKSILSQMHKDPMMSVSPAGLIEAVSGTFGTIAGSGKK